MHKPLQTAAQPQTPSRGRGKLFAFAGVAIAAVVVVSGAVSRVMAEQQLTNWTNAQAIPTVTLASLKGGDGAGQLQLPADVQAFNSAPINARVSGYLKRWYVDIGQPVKQGQVLGDIDTPDLDQQLAQAKADLATAQANEKLARTTAQRWSGLLAQDAVSKQDADTKNGDYAAKQALVNSAQANVRRLEALESFKRLVAPFPGVVTTRSTDIGQLITAGAPTATPLFTVADESRLRIYVHVPQSYTAQIHPGMTATVTVPEYPGRTFTAKLVNVASAINSSNGAQLSELWIDNADHALKPGEYAQATFALPAAPGAVRIPASALITRHQGMAVAVVGADSRVRLQPINIVQDLGTSVEVVGGVSPSDAVIDNPADTLQNGDLVRIAGASAEAHRRSQAHA